MKALCISLITFIFLTGVSCVSSRKPAQTRTSLSELDSFVLHTILGEMASLSIKGIWEYEEEKGLPHAPNMDTCAVYLGLNQDWGRNFYCNGDSIFTKKQIKCYPTENRELIEYRYSHVPKLPCILPWQDTIDFAKSSKHILLLSKIEYLPLKDIYGVEVYSAFQYGEYQRMFDRIVLHLKIVRNKQGFGFIADCSTDDFEIVDIPYWQNLQMSAIVRKVNEYRRSIGIELLPDPLDSLKRN
jgi:hypothetical protein